MSEDEYIEPPGPQPAPPPPSPDTRPVPPPQPAAAPSEEEYIEPPPAANYQGAIEDARGAGYQWSEIRGHIAQGTAAAADAGYNDAEIDAHLGFADPAGFERDARNGWAKQMAQNPELLTGLTAPEPKIDLSLSPDMASDYTRALLNGEVKGPQDFARRYAAAALNAAHELHGADATDPDVMAARRDAATEAATELAAGLPSREDLADATVALGGGQTTRERLMAHWTDTGTQPLDAAVQAQSDPSLADKLFAAPVAAVGAFGNFLKDIGVGAAAGTFYPDPEFHARYDTDRLAEALRQGAPPNLAEQLTAALTHALLAPGANYAEGLLKSGPETIQRVMGGKGFTIEEALGVAQYALSPAAGRYPGGRIPVEPEILPPQRGLPPPPGPGLPPREPIIIDHEAAGVPASELVKLPPPSPLEVINPEAPLGAPRETIPAKEALGPVPADDLAVHAAAQELSDIPFAEREGALSPRDQEYPPTPMPNNRIPRSVVPEGQEDFVGQQAARLEALRVENSATEGGGTFFQRILEQQIANREITPQQAAAIVEPKPQQITELAEGYDTAKSLYQHFSGILGDVLTDESGALTWRTPEAQAFWDNFSRSRDIAHRILIPNIQKGVKNDVLLARMMDSYRGAMAPHVNEFARASRASDGQAMIDSEIGKFIGYVENRTWGGTLRNSRLQPVADALAAIGQHGEKAMADAAAEGLIDVPTLIANWYKHLWKNPHGINWDNLTGGYSGVQGNATFTRKRSMPTMYDGMKAGLSPMFDNPIDQALYGEHLRGHYLNALRSIKAAMAEDQVYWAHGPREVNDIQLDGTTPSYDGPLGAPQRGVTPKIGTPQPGMVLYGQPGFARPYNNMLAMGMNAHPVGASVYNRLLWAGNMSTAIKLLWPGFHLRVIGLGTLATGAATMLDEVERLEFGKAFASAMKTAVFPVTAGEQMWKGFRSIYRYNRDMKDPTLDLLDSAGLRLTPRQSVYHVGPESLMETAKRGGFQPTQGRWGVLGGVQEIFRTIGRDLQAIKGDPRLEGTGGSVQKTFRTIGRGLQFPLTELGRVMQTATSPFFDYWIPAAKAGAGYVRLASWLDKNRFATDEQKWFKARQIVRDVENRFGELNQDTLFGPKLAKQIANVLMVSPGWKWGSWRGFLGAIGIDVERGGRLGKLSWNSINTNSLAGALIVYSMFNAVEQVAHGQPPFWKTDTAIADLANARIGGTSKWGGPARLMDPAELKELYDAAKVMLVSIYSPKDGPTAAAEYVMNALNPFWHAFYGTLSGRDGIGPQARSVQDRPGGYPAFLKETFGPIVYQQLQDLRPGSNLSKLEIFMGTREASKWVTDWNAYMQGMAKGHAYTTKEEIRRENKMHGIPGPGRPKKESAGERHWQTGR
jgi:hypothetical protein